MMVNTVLLFVLGLMVVVSVYVRSMFSLIILGFIIPLFMLYVGEVIDITANTMMVLSAVSVMSVMLIITAEITIR